MTRNGHDPWDLERPDRLLRHFGQEIALTEPATYLLRVERVAGQQRLTGWTQLWQEPPVVAEPDRTDLTEQALARLGVPTRVPAYDDRPLVVPVVVRPGHLVWTDDEREVFLGLRYAGNSFAFMHSELVVVGESGWWMPESDLTGGSPRARWSDQSVARMTSAEP